MPQTAPAATTEAETTDAAAEFKCSCGRSFAHEISLKRHRWVTGHAEAEASAPAAAAPTPSGTAVDVAKAPSLAGTLVAETPLLPGPFEPAYVPDDTYVTAMDTLMAKVREQQRLERRQQNLKLFAEFFVWMGSGARQMGRDALAAGRQAGQGGKQMLAALGRSLVVMVGMLILLLGGLSVGRALAIRNPELGNQSGRGFNSHGRLGGAHNTQAPDEVVGDFYQALNQHDYQAAYGQLSQDWQRQLAFAAFEAGYSRTESLNCKVSRVHQLSSGRARVSFTLESVEGNTVRNYVGSYSLVKTARGWQIDCGHLIQAD